MADLQTLHQLFEDELRDVYDAERQILKTLPKIIDVASDDGLREALSKHLDETRGHVDRLEQAFESLELKVRGKHCSGMEGILDEGRALLDQEGADVVLDAAFIAGCQRVEHYEITAYGSLMAWAQVLDYSEALELLKANEAEEKAADAKLTKLAESTINRQARAAGDQRHNEQPRKQLSSRR